MAKAVSVLMARCKGWSIADTMVRIRYPTVICFNRRQVCNGFFKARDFFGGNAAFASCFALVAPVGENSPPDCFLPLALLAPSLFESLYQYIIKTDTAKAVSVLMARCKGFEPLTFWFVGFSIASKYVFSWFPEIKCLA